MGWGPGEKTNSTKSTTERGTSTWYVSKRARKVWVMQTISEVVDSARPGDSYVLKLHYRPPSGRRTPYRLTFPLDFTPSVEVMPLLVFFHGWTSSHDGRESIAMHDYGRRTGILVVSPTGFEDLRGGPSWNGSGTVGSPGPAGRTCYDPHNSFNLCYDSCGHCADTCWWTTCEDSVAQVVALLGELESSLPFNLASRFAAGHSNGGMFLYELASDHRSAHLFDGYISISGAPHKGFNRPPLRAPVPFFGIWGESDGMVPAFASPAADGFALDRVWNGWYYHTASSVVGLWSSSNGCASEPELSSIQAGVLCGLDGDACVGEVDGRCETWRWCADGVEVTYCLHPAGHGMPSWAAAATRNFIRRHERVYASASIPPRPPPRSPPITPPSPSPITPPSPLMPPYFAMPPEQPPTISLPTWRSNSSSPLQVNESALDVSGLVSDSATLAAARLSPSLPPAPGDRPAVVPPINSVGLDGHQWALLFYWAVGLLLLLVAFRVALFFVRRTMLKRRTKHKGTRLEPEKPARRARFTKRLVQRGGETKTDGAPIVAVELESPT